MAAATFADVQKVLDNIISTWTKGSGGPPDLTGAHNTALFQWDTQANLLASSAFGFQLIQDSAKKVGQGATANLIVALTKAGGVVDPATGTGFGQMPDGGLSGKPPPTFLTIDSPQIKTLISWIESLPPPVAPAVVADAR